jgi:hypothetical protein
LARSGIYVEDAASKVFSLEKIDLLVDLKTSCFKYCVSVSLVDNHIILNKITQDGLHKTWPKKLIQTIQIQLLYYLVDLECSLHGAELFIMVLMSVPNHIKKTEKNL